MYWQGIATANPPHLCCVTFSTLVLQPPPTRNVIPIPLLAASRDYSPFRSATLPRVAGATHPPRAAVMPTLGAEGNRPTRPGVTPSVNGSVTGCGPATPPPACRRRVHHRREKSRRQGRPHSSAPAGASPAPLGGGGPPPAARSANRRRGREARGRPVATARFPTPPKLPPPSERVSRAMDSRHAPPPAEPHGQRMRGEPRGNSQRRSPRAGPTRAGSKHGPGPTMADSPPPCGGRETGRDRERPPPRHAAHRPRRVARRRR